MFQCGWIESYFFFVICFSQMPGFTAKQKINKVINKNCKAYIKSLNLYNLVFSSTGAFHLLIRGQVLFSI